MKKIIFTITMLALLGSQVQTAKAHGRGGWGWGVGVGVLGGFALGTAVGATYARPAYYDSYYYSPGPYWGSGFYSPGYYYPPANNPYPAAPAPAPATQPQVSAQNVTINNNYYNAPASPMSGANSLFGR